MAMKTVPRFDLSGWTALVTGGGYGLGYSFAGVLAEAGATVMICGRKIDKLQSAAGEITSAHGAPVHFATVDLSERATLRPLVEAAEAAMGHVDILVANAATAALPVPVDLLEEADLDLVVETNLKSSILLTRLLVPGMKAQGWGRLVYLTSAGSMVSTAEDGQSLYTATKAGLEGFMRTVAVEMGPFGITANCLAPGVFMTEMIKQHFATLSEDGTQAVNMYASMCAVPRWGENHELEGPLLLLVSDAGSYLTGAVIRVDGGLTIKMRPSPIPLRIGSTARWH
jgi:NAD(P)-dependent dehydrogenase (short-subunit alcohol dehydrogenase family)